MNEGIVIFLGCFAGAVLIVATAGTETGRALAVRAFFGSGSLVRRAWWWLVIRVTWKATCREAGVSKRYTKRKVDRVGVGVESIEKWKDPRLKTVRTSAHAVTLKARTRRGQPLKDLETFGASLAATYDAEVYRVYAPKKRSGSTVLVDLVKRNLIKKPAIASMPDPRAVWRSVRLGRTQAGKPWWFQIYDRHTLVIGAAGSGKGSILWGILGALAPAISVDLVRAHGIDLKGGVELKMGERLLTTKAYDVDAALALLEQLLEIIDDRLEAMAGDVRMFVPTPGSPLHLLIIDELLVLTAFGSNDTKKRVAELLGNILARGRAAGVMVVGFAQVGDKASIPMRDHFTQTIALRLRSPEQTTMVLGEGMRDLAPAHRIARDAQGTAWLIEEDGTVDRVRADFWSDALIRQIAEIYGAEPDAGSALSVVAA